MIKLDFNKHHEKTISIKGKSDVFHTKVKDITHIVCEEYMCTIYLVDGKKYSTTHSLKCFEEILTEDDFCPVNRNTLINTEYAITARTTHKEKSVNVNGINITVSRRRFAQLKKILLR